jgi:hypothetical protein
MRNIVITLSLILLLPMFGGGRGMQCLAQSQQKRVVVLDAGHGNPRPGKVQNQVKFILQTEIIMACHFQSINATWG